MKAGGALALIGAGLATGALIWRLSRRRYLRGDVNGNGVVDMGDVIALGRIIAGLDPVNPRADVNGDGVVDQLDVEELGRIILGSA